METALGILNDEHQNILKVINALLKECNYLQSGNKIDKVFFEKTLDFARNYADKFHHAKEEDILFREFRGSVEERCSHCNPLEQMLYEHNLGRGFVKELETGIDENNREKIIKNARGYAQLLQEHIFKEDNILYPMADELLSQNTKDKMLGEFVEVEQKLAKEKERSLSFLREIKERI